MTCKKESVEVPQMPTLAEHLTSMERLTHEPTEECIESEFELLQNISDTVDDIKIALRRACSRLDIQRILPLLARARRLMPESLAGFPMYTRTEDEIALVRKTAYAKIRAKVKRG